MIGLLAAVMLQTGNKPVEAHPESAPVLSRVLFSFERKSINQRYSFDLKQDGSGTYTVEAPAFPPATPAETVTMPLMLRPSMVAMIFEQMKNTNRLRSGCESRAKNVAQTGTKTLTLEDGGPVATCSWNYSENRMVLALGEEFAAMAYTLDEGRKLAMEQRFDRLGLDREMGFLVDAVKEGRALGLANIAPVLSALAEDNSLLERVRAQAKRLLEQSALGR